MSVPSELARLKRDIASLEEEIGVSTGPRAKVPLMQLLQLTQTAPENALAQFRIEASTGL